MSTVTFPDWLAQQHPAIPLAGARAILALAEGGATVPFIARYRKEQTGNLDEVAIRQVLDAQGALGRDPQAAGVHRRGDRPPGKADARAGGARPRDVRRARCSRTSTCPTSRSGRPRPQIAREAGLEPLADWLWDAAHGEIAAGAETPEARAAGVLRRRQGRRRRRPRRWRAPATSSSSAWPRTRRCASTVRTRATSSEGCARTRKGDKAKPPSRFENYFAYQEPVRELLKPRSSHRYLAMRRGWMEEELVLSLGGALPATTATTRSAGRRAGRRRSRRPRARRRRTFAGAPLLKRAARLALRGSRRAVDRDRGAQGAARGRRRGGDHACSPRTCASCCWRRPSAPRRCWASIPGLRTGCKLAVVDALGQVRRQRG